MRQKSPEEVQRELREAEAKLPEARRQLMPLPGIIDVLVGIKEKGRQSTGQVVFHVLVNKKKPRHPGTLNGNHEPLPRRGAIRRERRLSTEAL